MLLYYDNEAETAIPAADLPRSAGGSISFMEAGAAHTEDASIDSWEGVYGNREESGLRTDLGNLAALAETEPELFVYNRHIFNVASGLEGESAALEIGCGTASMALMLNHNHGLSCYGVDISEKAVSLARRRFALLEEEPDLLSVADVVELPFPDAAFHLVFGKTVFEHFEKPEAAASEIARVLAPGGFLVLDVPNSRNSYWTFASERARGHTHTTLSYTIEELSGLFLREGLEIQQTWGDGLLYTTPYILLSSLFRREGRMTEGGGEVQTAGTPESRRGGGGPLRLLSPLDSGFKKSLRSFNRLANRRGWANSKTGVLVGVVARKKLSNQS